MEFLSPPGAAEGEGLMSTTQPNPTRPRLPDCLVTVKVIGMPIPLDGSSTSVKSAEISKNNIHQNARKN